jgi:hypothetical protein
LSVILRAGNQCGSTECQDREESFNCCMCFHIYLSFFIYSDSAKTKPPTNLIINWTKFTRGHLKPT